jgi:hypothetical protein
MKVKSYLAQCQILEKEYLAELQVLDTEYNAKRQVIWGKYEAKRKVLDDARMQHIQKLTSKRKKGEK